MVEIQKGGKYMKKTSYITGIILIMIFIYTNSTSNFTLFHQSPHPKIPPHDYLTKIIQEKQPKLTKEEATQISKAVYKYSNPFPPELIISLAFQESSLLKNKTSKAGCVGLMQIYPKFHPEKVKGFSKAELYEVDTNIRVGCQILREYYISTQSITKALYRYFGAENKQYAINILSSCVDEIILKNSKQ